MIFYRRAIKADQENSRFRISVLTKAMRILTVFVMIGGVLGCWGGSVGTECIQPSDCSDGLWCIYGRCVVQCKQSKDCNDSTTMCVKNKESDNKSAGYCKELISCGGDAACQAKEEDKQQGQTCADGVCRDRCTDNNDCPLGQVCFTNHLCYEGCGDDDDCKIHPDNSPPQKCINNKCALSEPEANAKGLLKMPCSIHSDCKSVNCINSICQGCRWDADCNGRLCSNANVANPDEGTCVGGENATGPENPTAGNSDGTGGSGGMGGSAAIPGAGGSGQAAELPFEELPSGATEIFVENIVPEYAALSPEGQDVYFIEGFTNESGEYFSISKSTNDASPLFVCIVNAVPHGPVTINHDNTKLYYGGGTAFESGVFEIDLSQPSCDTPALIPWTKNCYVQAMTIRSIQNEDGTENDMLYVGGINDEGNVILSGDPANAIQFTQAAFDPGTYSIAAGDNHIFLSPYDDLNGISNNLFLGVIENESSQSFWKLHVANMDTDLFNVALNSAGDTLYIAINDWNGRGYLFSLSPQDGPLLHHQYKTNVKNIFRIQRASKKDVFLLSTINNEFYRVKL